jgi:hypothetical protein
VGQESRVRIELHPKQQEAFQSPATEIGYGGAAGGGKSFFLRAFAIFACSQLPGLQVYLFRKHYDELIRNHVDGPGGFREVLEPWVRDKKARIIKDQVQFWNGSKIHLCHCSQNKDLDKYLGPEMPVLLIDQAEQFPERWIRFLRGRVRMPDQMRERAPQQFRDKFPCAIYSFNPGGISHSYFRKQFVKAAKPLEVWQAPRNEGGMVRQFIPAYLRDNPSLDEDQYSAALEGLNDAQLVRALLEGDFDALVGNYFTQYEEIKHVTDDNFPIPPWWFKFTTFDWGSSEPFAFLWWAVSDGEPFEYQGEKLWYPAGSLILYREWYGCLPDKTAAGQELTNEAMAKGYLARTREQTSGLVITDSLPFQNRGFSRNGQRYTIADEFLSNGVRLTHGNTDRIYGWKQVRDRLIGKDGLPLIYIQPSCVYTRDYLPALTRDDNNPEDAAKDGEATHICDAIRLACTLKPLITKQPNTLDNTRSAGTIGVTTSDLLKKLTRGGNSILR